MDTTTVGIELKSAEYEAASETYRYEFDPDETPPSMAVVAALSDARDDDPLATTPIYEGIDADALDSLWRASGDTEVRVAWTDDAHDITVASSGVVTVSPSSTGRDTRQSLREGR